MVNIVYIVKTYNTMTSDNMLKFKTVMFFSQAFLYCEHFIYTVLLHFDLSSEGRFADVIMS